MWASAADTFIFLLSVSVGEQWGCYCSDVFLVFSEPDVFLIVSPAGPRYRPHAAFKGHGKGLDIGALQSTL